VKASSSGYARPLFFLTLLFLSAFFTAAQDATIVITDIQIEGLRRTQLATAKRPLQQFIGLEVSRIDENAVKAAVLATGILEPVSVEIIGQTLTVTVREKWAIFPIPIFMGSADEIGGGLSFFDANAFGLNDKLFLAGMYYSGAWIASAGYIHSATDSGIPGWNSTVAFTRAERQDRNQNNEALRRFNLDSISASLGISVPLQLIQNNLSASTLLSFRDTRLRPSDNAVNSPLDDVRIFGIGTRVSIGRNSWDGFLLSREAASLRYVYYADFASTSFHSVRLNGTWEKSLLPGFRLTTRTGLSFEPRAPILFESSPGVSQVDILPISFSARSYAGLSAGLEKSLVRFPAGTLTVLAAYQIVYSDGSILGGSFDHGYMGMLSFYLNRFAMPGLGVGFAYNVDKRYFQITFGMGGSF